MEKTIDPDWGEWLCKTMPLRPKGNQYIDSKRGEEVATLCLAFERKNFSWRRSDPDTFWVDIQLFVKYGLSDDDIIFICSAQPGVNEYKEHKEERKAYSEMMRGMQKLKDIAARKASK